MPTTVMAGSSRGSCSRVPRNTGSAEKIAMATMNAGAAPIADKTPLHRSLANDDFERNRRAAAYQAQIDGASDALGTEQAHDFANAIDWPPVPGGHDIADEHSGARGRSIRIEAHQQNAAPAAQRLRSV